MAVVFYIPSYLRNFTEGRGRVPVSARAATVGEALTELWMLYPGVRDRVVDEQGKLRRHVNVFVGDVNIRDARGLDTVLPHGTEISIIPAVSGGRRIAGHCNRGLCAPRPDR